MFLWESIAFGPIFSRRLGSSLGINISPTHTKICSFDCIYCECGWTKDAVCQGVFPTVDEVVTAIEMKLKKCKEENTAIDSITFSGNGEPTLHPQFEEIIDKLLLLREQYYPKCVIACLSNSTQLHRVDVKSALQKIENPILKLDAGSEHFFQWVDRPNVPLKLSDILPLLKEFRHELIIQTMILKGEIDGKVIDNSQGQELELLIKNIKEVAPKKVMLYSLDRETPAKKLTKISKEKLEEIAKMIRQNEVEVEVY